MRIDILTLFPEVISAYLESSIIKRGIESNKFEVIIHNFRDYSTNKHLKVDDTIYGGGAGMLISVEPIVRCLKDIPDYDKAFKILTSPAGIKYDEGYARKFSKYDHIIIICGHYEGIDARILNYVDCVCSIGDYVLTGGELAALAVMDSVVRLIPGVISMDSTVEESFNNNLLECDQYTKPQEYDGYSVPDVLLSGNHEEIRLYRLENSIKKTLDIRPDLIDKGEFNTEEKAIIDKVKQSK